MKINKQRFQIIYKATENRAARVDNLTGWQMDNLIADDRVAGKIASITPMEKTYTVGEMRALRLLK